jgi:OOP family OmpA-OmpF porin
MKKLALITICSALAFPVCAEGFYVVGAVGQTTTDLDTSAVEGPSAGKPGFSSTTDGSDTGYKLQLGYKFNPYLAVEGGYVNLGRASYQAKQVGVGQLSHSFRAQGLNVAAVGILPLGERFSLFAKGGLLMAQAESDETLTKYGYTTTYSFRSSKLSENLGVGMGFDLTKRVALRAEYDWFHNVGDKDKTGQANIAMLSAGVVFKF